MAFVEVGLPGYPQRGVRLIPIFFNDDSHQEAQKVYLRPPTSLSLRLQNTSNKSKRIDLSCPPLSKISVTVVTLS